MGQQDDHNVEDDQNDAQEDWPPTIVTCDDRGEANQRANDCENQANNPSTLERICLPGKGDPKGQQELNDEDYDGRNEGDDEEDPKESIQARDWEPNELNNWEEDNENEYSKTRDC